MTETARSRESKYPRKMEDELLPCRICKELEQHLHSAQQPDTPALLLGLTEAGMRNRTHQRQERIQKVELDIERHQKAFHKGAKPATE